MIGKVVDEHKSNNSIFKLNEKVIHPAFGEGIITKINLESYEITFNDGIKRIISFKYTNLKKMNSIIEEVKEVENLFKVGDCIKHDIYGYGVVKNVESDAYIILFKKNNIRLISFKEKSKLTKSDKILLETKIVKDEKKESKPLTHFSVNTNVYHDIFGKGIIKKVLTDMYEIEFENSVVRKIARSYMRLSKKIDTQEINNVSNIKEKTVSQITNNKINSKVKPASPNKLNFEINDKSKKFIFHNSFGYGKLINVKDSSLVIEFLNDVTKTISKSFTGMKFVTEEEYLQGNIKKEKIENIIPQKTSNLIHHRHYGNGVIVGEKDIFYDVLMTNAEIINLRKDNIDIKFLDDSYNEENLKTIHMLDHIYGYNVGFGQVLSIKEDVVILWKNQNLKRLPLNYLKIVDKVDDIDNIYINLKPFDYVYYNNKVYLLKKIYINQVCIEDIISKKEKYVELYKLRKATTEELKSYYEIVDYYRDIDLRFLVTLEKEIYYIDEIGELYLNFYKKQFSTVVLDYLMYKLNFNKDGDFYVKRKYSSIEEYLLNQSFTKDIYRNEYENNEQFYHYLEKLCDKNYLIKYENNIYFTFIKMKTLGLSLHSFEEFKKKLDDYLSFNHYIILSKIRNEISCDLTEKIISDIALSNILESVLFRDIKRRDFGRTVIYHKRDLTTKDEFLINLIKNKINNLSNKRQIDVYDLIYLLNDEFNFGYDYTNFVYKLNKLNEYKDIYFSEEMDKVYIDKKDYYMEVYGNGK